MPLGVKESKRVCASNQKRLIIKRSKNMNTIHNLKIATTNSQIKYKNRDDLLLVTFDPPATVAGVFTSSTMPAAPVTWCKNSVKSGLAKALIVNAGNANAFTGKSGEEIVNQTASTAAQLLNCPQDQIFISSTGVIGEVFDYKLITNKLATLTQNLENNADSITKAAKAIMTTDTTEKIVHKTCEIEGKQITISGFAKGSGMIAPNMATMLGYIFCNATIAADALQQILKEHCEESFNAITVDSDQSTNDTVLLFATNEVNHSAITNSNDPKLAHFKQALKELMVELAKKIVVDGEGAKKLIEINVSGASDKTQAKYVAFQIANSPLVKTAIAGCDPNWGRIVMAVGKSGVPTTPEKLVIKIGPYQLTKDGKVAPNYSEKDAHNYLKNSQVHIDVDLGLTQDPSNQATVWTCDLNEEYIKINKDYRS